MNFSSLNPIKQFQRFNNWLESKNWFAQIVILLSIVFFVRSFIFGLYWVPTGSMEPTILVGEVFFADKLTAPFRTIKHGDIISFNDPTFKYSDSYFAFLFQKYAYGPENWTKRVIGIPGDRIQGRIEDGKPVVYRNGEKINEPYVNKYPIVRVIERSHQLTLPINKKVNDYWFPFITVKEAIRHRTFDPSFSKEIASNNKSLYIIKEEDLSPNKFTPEILYPNVPSLAEREYGSVKYIDVFDITLADDEYYGMGDNRRGSFDSRCFGVIKKEFIHGRILFRLFSFNTSNSLVYELFFNTFDFFKNKLRPWSRWFCFIK